MMQTVNLYVKMRKINRDDCTRCYMEIQNPEHKCGPDPSQINRYGKFQKNSDLPLINDQNPHNGVMEKYLFIINGLTKSYNDYVVIYNHSNRELEAIPRGTGIAVGFNIPWEMNENCDNLKVYSCIEGLMNMIKALNNHPPVPLVVNDDLKKKFVSALFEENDPTEEITSFYDSIPLGEKELALIEKRILQALPRVAILKKIKDRSIIMGFHFNLTKNPDKNSFSFSHDIPAYENSSYYMENGRYRSVKQVPVLSLHNDS